MKNISFIVLFLYSIIAYAQELTIKSFQEATMDLTARTTPRKDANGNDCALVKVQLASANAEFEGNVVGNVRYNTSEYHVYMSCGSKQITIKLVGYLPLNVKFADYKVNTLASCTTYLLIVTGVNAANAQTQEMHTKTGWILLDSEPSDAAVYINNEFVGNTPLDSYKQPFGTYNYKIEKPNYHDASGTIELYSAQYEKTVKLNPAFGSIKVEYSSAYGDSVLLDGKNTGKSTPCILDKIAPGKHIVIVQKELYAPQEFIVNVEEGKTTGVTATLEERYARITINSIKDASITIDNKQKGHTYCDSQGVYKFSNDLAEGFHNIEVSKEHYKTITKQIQVTRGEPQTITLEPTPIYGMLDVKSKPSDANIVLDGKYVGQTPFKMENIFEGEHVVELTKEGHKLEEKKVSVSEGKTEKISVSLSKNDAFDYVDLGLSVKWAKCNIGASSPEIFGDFYAWAEVETKTTYNWDTYKHTEYNNSNVTGISKHEIEQSDDAAHEKLGGSWRIPSFLEICELRDKCKWVQTTYNGVKGIKVIGPNGNQIFLPAAGYKEGKEHIYDSWGGFWSNELHSKEQYARVIYFDLDEKKHDYVGVICYYGLPIRPVYP